MNWIPSFTAWQYAVGGLVAALGPVLIHLLTRRRHRKLPWAAMQLLEQAARESRRSVRFRDGLLLLLRCAALFLFGLALAQPYFRGSRPGVGLRAVELILLIDNSLSMGYEARTGVRLDQAKRLARQRIIEATPGSQFRVVPLCGSGAGEFVDLIPLADDALVAVDAISLVDRAVDAKAVLDTVRELVVSESPRPKQWVCYSDFQKLDWERADPAEFDEFAAIEFVDLADSDWENHWIGRINLQDGLADASTETSILVDVGNHSEQPKEVDLRIAVDGVPVAVRTIKLASDEPKRSIVFAHKFNMPTQGSGRVHWARIAATFASDRLPADDARVQFVPVVAGLPVVFVDEYGDREDANVGRVGETLPLRRLLNGSTSVDEGVAIQERHLRIDQLSRRVLADARLVVVAGVRDPSTAVGLLREYVEQGGQLIVTAGGVFDAARWQETAWQGGNGILPAPLVVKSPLASEPTVPIAMTLDAKSLRDHAYFEFAGETSDARTHLFQEPIFFRTIEVAEVADGEGSVRSADGETWLRWRAGIGEGLVAERAETPATRVLARFDHQKRLPYLVECSVGRGRLIFFGSGAMPPWSTLSRTNAVLLLDRVARHRLRATFEERNRTARDRLVVPLPGVDVGTSATILRPGRQIPESLDIGFVPGDQRGVVIERAVERGIYEVVLSTIGQDDATGAVAPDAARLALAIYGPDSESDLTPLGGDARRQLFGELVANPQQIDSSSTPSTGNGIWWWIMLGVLWIVAAEMTVANPKLWARRGEAPHSSRFPSKRD